MPDTIRRSGGYARPWLGGFPVAIGAVAPLPAHAETQAPGAGAASTRAGRFAQHRPPQIAVLVLLVGLLVFAVVTAILLVRARAGWARLEISSHDEIAALRADLDRANALLASEPQVMVDWPAAADEPFIEGDPAVVGVSAPHRVLAFGSWLDAGKASAMERAVEALRARGEAFSMAFTTLSGRPIEAQGRAIAGRAVLRLKDASGVKRDLLDLAERYEALQSEIAALRALIEKLPSPVWLRDATGRLIFVNAAYAQAVEARDPADAIERSLELLDSAARANIAQARHANGGYAGRLPAVVAGARRSFDVLDFQTETGSAGLGIDATEAETMRSALARLVDAHRRTLDQLSTGVAMFGADQKLTFYNAAYRALWNLDAAFLDRGPTDSAVLEELRATRKLPEERDFRQWKAQLHGAYQRHGGQGTNLASARRPDVARGHHAQSGWRRHLSVQRRDRTARSRPAVRRADPRPGRNARQSRRRRRGVRAATAACGCPTPHSPACGRLSPETLAERPHIETISALMPVAARRRPDLASAAAGHHRHRQPPGDFGPARTPRRHRGRLHHRAAARLCYAGDVP